MEEAGPTKHSDNEKRQYEYYLDVTLHEFTNKEDYDNRHSIIIGYLLSLANTEVSSVPSHNGPVSINDYKTKPFNKLFHTILITGAKKTTIHNVIKITSTIRFHHLVNSERLSNLLTAQKAYIKRHHWGEETKVTIAHSHYVIGHDPANSSPFHIQDMIINTGKTKQKLKEAGIIFRVVPTKIQQLNVKDKEKVRIKVFALEIDRTEMKTMNEIISSEFSQSHLLLPAFYKLNRTNFHLWNNGIKFHNDLQHSLIRGSIIGVTEDMMKNLRPTLAAISGVHEIYSRMDTKVSGNYNIMYTKKNVQKTETAIKQEIENIIVPDGHLFEQPTLLQKNSPLTSSINSISSSSNPFSTIFYDKSKCEISTITPAEGTRTFAEIVKQAKKQQEVIQIPTAISNEETNRLKALETEVKELRQIKSQFEKYKQQYPSQEAESESVSVQLGHQIRDMRMSIMNDLMCDVSGMVEKLFHDQQQKQTSQTSDDKTTITASTVDNTVPSTTELGIQNKLMHENTIMTSPEEDNTENTKRKSDVISTSEEKGETDRSKTCDATVISENGSTIQNKTRLDNANDTSATTNVTQNNEGMNDDMESSTTPTKTNTGSDVTDVTPKRSSKTKSKPKSPRIRRVQRPITKYTTPRADESINDKSLRRGSTTSL